MGAETPARGGENKPEVKTEGNANAGHNRHSGNYNKTFNEKEKFLGADPDLQGFVFESASTRAHQVTNFNTVDTQIKSIIGQQCDPYVLESLEKMVVTLPDEPGIETIEESDVAKKKVLERKAEMKFKSKFDRWLTRTEKIEKEMNQSYELHLPIDLILHLHIF